MIKFSQLVLLIVLQFWFLQDIYSQEQVNVTDYLSDKFMNYCESVPREEIFVHSDRDNYVAGEDLWFNIYLIDRQSMTPAASSQIAYLEVLNQENRPVAQRRIKFDNGFGPGHIALPDTLASGTYTIRAYTSWMKNFLPENCFMKDIKVYNVFSKKNFKGKLPPESSVEMNDKFNTNGEISFTVDNNDPYNLKILISSSENYLRNNSNVILFIQTHGKINYVGSEKILSRNTLVNINKKNLIPGINHITLFNSDGSPFQERFIFTPQQEIQDHFLVSSEINKTRSKVSVDLQVGNIPIDDSKLANLSVSVALGTDLNEMSSINEYLIFGSEFGIEPWKTLAGRRINEIPADDMENLLHQLKSNWINWSLILSENPPWMKYKAEAENQFLTGRLINRNSGSSDSGKYIFMSTPGKEAIFQYATTDHEADFSFSINIDDRYKDLIIQPAETGSNLSIKVNSPFSEIYFPSGAIDEQIGINTQSAFSGMSVNYQVSKIFEASFVSDTLRRMFPEVKTKRFYGKPDIELIMADYIKLPVMEEVFFELLPGVFLKNKRSGYEITISDPVSNKIYETPPGLFIDGVIIYDPSLIANMDPEKVERIDVIKDRYFVGDYLFYGIINIITIDGDFSNFDLPEYSTRMQYRVIDPVGSFVSPDYMSDEDMKKRIPDFRNTLYWNPSVKPDSDGKARLEFWTSDILSDYVINIQGITSEGELVSFKKIIKVE